MNTIGLLAPSSPSNSFDFRCDLGFLIDLVGRNRLLYIIALLKSIYHFY